MYRVYSCGLLPTPSQEILLNHWLDYSRYAYNHGLKMRRDEYQKYGHTVGEYDQNNDLSDLRQMMPGLALCPSRILQSANRRLDKAFKAFYRRVKAGETPGYPRFKGWGQWRSVAFPVESKFIYGSRIKPPTMERGIITRGMNWKIEGKMKFCTIVKKAGKWYCNITVETGMPAPAKVPVNSVVGIDVGLNKFAVLSDHTEIINPRFVRTYARRIARAQRKIARKVKGSNNRRKAVRYVQKLYNKLTNKRSNFTHEIAKWIVDRFQFIAVENLNVSGMVRGRLAKSILDAAWSQFIARLGFKAENAGCQLVKVDPRGTSQECSRCGQTVQKSLAVRIHKCPYCGLEVCRDWNASANILHRGLLTVPDLLIRFGNAYCTGPAGPG